MSILIQNNLKFERNFMYFILKRFLGLSAFLVVIFSSINALATEIIVNVESEIGTGNIGCALFSSPDGFPMNTEKALQQFKPNTSNKAQFTFSNVKAGTYSISVFNDQNDNKVIDTNLFGIPKEEWGVSNNIKPKLKAPKFEEASFVVEEQKNLDLNIRISK